MAVDGGGVTGVRTIAGHPAADRLHHLDLIAPALLVVVWVELVRLWFPTVATQVAWSTVTPAGQSLIVTAAIAVSATLLAVTPLSRAGARHRVALAVVALLAVRTVLTLGATGGRTQLALAGLGVAAGLVGLIGLASGSAQPGRVRLGVGIGLLGAVIVHTATGTRGLLWSPAGWTSVVTLLLIAAAGMTTARLWRDRGIVDAAVDPTTTGRAVRGWPWWTLTPSIVLVLAVSGVPGRTMVATGWSPSTAAMTVAGIHLGAAVMAGIRPRLPRVPVLALVTLGLPAAVLAASDGQGWSVVIGQAGVALGVALLLTVPEPDPGARTARVPGLVTGAALVLALVGFDLYHLADDRLLVLANLEVHALVGLSGSVLAIALIRTRPAGSARPRLDVRGLLTAAATAIVIVAGVGALNPFDPRPAEPVAGSVSADQLRVALVNVGSGFDPQGRFVATAQGRFLADHDLDVVVLTEVDRGRMVAGGHDGLQTLADELGFPTIVFAPTADQVSGIALLTRLDVTETAREKLPPGSDPQRRGSLATVVNWPDDTPLGLIGAQLSDRPDQSETRLPQARAVAGTVALLRERQVASVVLADLRADAGSPELSTFTSLLDDALPEGTHTVPAHDPEHRDEHILISPELRLTDLALPRVPWSDRLPLIVTLERRTPIE